MDELRSTPEYQEYVEQIMRERRSRDFEKWVESYYREYGNMYEVFGERMGLKPEIVQGMVERIRDTL